ncbi:MAG TPA: 6-phosphogluconolactonase [Anaerolineaceae bacterium]
MIPDLHIFPDPEALCRFAADEFSRFAQAAAKKHHPFRVALSGGSTPQRLFTILAAPPHQQAIPWEFAELFWGDERCVPPDHPESNYFQAYTTLLRSVPIPQSNIYRIKGELPPEKAAQDYADLLARLAPPGLAYPIFDLVLLGMGADGHTASLFPGSDPQITQPVIPVTAHYQDRPANRVTLTPPVINAARNILVLVTGESKAQALADALQGKHDPARLPIQRINPVNGKLTWLVDRNAARMLPSPRQNNHPNH